MQLIEISDGTTLMCFPKEDVLNDIKDPNREFFLEIYSVIENLSTLLQVPCPDIAIAETITQINDKTFEVTEMDGMTYHEADFPELNNSIIQILVTINNNLRMTGVLAHEMRHIYQKKYTPEIFQSGYAQGYEESLIDVAEIDADAFAIWHLEKAAGITTEKAACIICPLEKKYNPKAFFNRIEKAKEIATEMEEALMRCKQKKKTLWEKLISFLKRKISSTNMNV